ncbi:MAG TPA: hypothetical protein VII23_08045, partial [Terriglobales bacterium]
LLQASFPTVVGLQQLAPQIVPVRFRHCWFAAESRRNPLYTYIGTALERTHNEEDDGLNSGWLQKQMTAQTETAK